MKTGIIAGLLLGLGGLAPVSANAGGFDGSRPLLCATGQMFECAAGADCMQVTSDAIDAPDFLRLDFESKRITSVSGSTDRRSTPMERLEQVDGKLILQGAEEEREDIQDGLGWTIAISHASGKMVLSASGDQVAFVAFGACTPL
jgi:hypothetical protein